jgi:hypothetical protein
MRQLQSKDAPADHMTLAWPVKFCDGIKQYRRFCSSFMQIIGEMMFAKNKLKIIKG